MGTLGGAALKRALLATMILVVGAAVGGGAARIAESTVVADVAGEAQALDRLSSLSEAAALMQAAVNQAMLLAGTDQPAVLARAEADAALRIFESALDASPPETGLTDAGRNMIAQVENVFRDLDAGRPVGAVGAATPALKASYERFSDVVADRRRSARAQLASSEDDAGAATVTLTALVLFLAPAAVSTATVWWVHRRLRAPEPAIRSAEETSAEPPPMPPVMARVAAAESAQNVATVVKPQVAKSAPRHVVAQHLVTLDRIRTGTLSLVTGRIDIAPIAGRVAGQVPDYDGLVDVLARQVEVVADPLRVDDILTLLLSASLGSGATKLALVVEAETGMGRASVAGAGAELSQEALRALDHPGESEDPVALELSVAGQLARLMEGSLIADRFEDMTVLTLELPLADR